VRQIGKGFKRLRRDMGRPRFMSGGAGLLLRGRRDRSCGTGKKRRGQNGDRNADAIDREAQTALSAATGSMSE
jgi:hypothetical protein